MARALRLVIGQLNTLVGDVSGNVERVIAAATDARDRLRAGIIVFPELTLTGYPPEDLLLRLHLYGQVQAGLERLQREAQGITIVVGHPQRVDDRVYNAASVIAGGRIMATYFKHLLPNYSVFDEKRYFSPGTDPCVVSVDGVPVGITICEDVWQPDAVMKSTASGARLILVLNASPYHARKGYERERLIQQRVSECKVPMVYVNLVGGQDELVFDGESFVIDGSGRLAQRCPAFEAGLYEVDFDIRDGIPIPVQKPVAEERSVEEEVYRALVLGVRDYVEKNRFPGVAIGLSGGIDSALTLCIAVDAFGPQRVEALMMPSRYTSAMSLEDARAQAQALGVAYHVLPIDPLFETFLATLKDEFQGRARDVTEENLQARIRGTLLMAVSNKTGKMILTTGNKSEMAVGYATLYGDMAGGFGAIKDVYKTLVYRLAEYCNRQGEVIPRRVIERAPSAELAPDQKDSDSLPPYDILDRILELYVEQDRAPREIVAAGFDAETVRRVAAMVDRNEYKRRQAVPGVRISRRAFGRDRRYPITSGYRE
jgi:NAD+ synthase (glutamine-hydrolysing)